MAEPIRVALIGYGYAGRSIHAPLIGSVAGLELTVIGSRQPEDELRAELPGIRVIADPLKAATDPGAELIVIATPNESHAPLAEAALRAGKHVVVDKPFTVTLEEARRLAKLAGETGCLLSVFQNRRWDSDFLTVAGAIRDGRLGDVAHVESRIDRYRPEVKDRWREGSQPGGGLWWDLGPHLADQALHLFGLPERVTAHIALQRVGAKADDWFQVMLTYPKLHVILGAGMLVSGGTQRFIAHGSRASLVKRDVDVQENQLRAGMVPRDLDWGIDLDAATLFDGATGETELVTAIDGDYCRFYDAIRDALTEGAANPVSPAEGVATMAILEAAQASAREGRSLPPPLLPEEIADFETGRANSLAVSAIIARDAAASAIF
jgi:predicted dehydrogenase